MLLNNIFASEQSDALQVISDVKKIYTWRTVLFFYCHFSYTFFYSDFYYILGVSYFAICHNYNLPITRSASVFILFIHESQTLLFPSI